MLINLLLALLFFLSGACGLIYETVWVRELSYIFGNTVIATTLVLTAFMTGLALGSGTLGARAGRLGRPLKVYGWLELAIAITAVLVEPALRWVKQLHGVVIARPDLPTWAPFALEFVLVLVLLVIPTACMGSTLPVLCRWAATRGGGVGSSLGILYGLNNLGAVVGGLFSGFWLIQNLGLSMTTMFSVALNVVVGVVALVMDKLTEEPEVDGEAAARPADPAAASDGVATPVVPQGPPLVPRSFLYFSIFVAGAAAMVLEIALIKVLPLVLGASTYSFSLMVSAFIAGIAAGSSVVGVLLPYIRRPVAFLGFLMVSAGLLFLITIPLYNWLPVFYLWLKSRVSGSFEVMQALSVFICFLMMSIPTFFMGGILPVAVHLAVRGTEDAASTTGRIYAANTVGNIIGSIVTGLVLIPRLGFKSTMELGIVLQLVVGIMLLLLPASRGRFSRWLAAGTILVVVLYAVLYPKPDLLALTAGVFRTRVANFQTSIYEFVHKGRTVIFCEEDEQAFVSVEESEKGNLGLKVNGKPDASSHTDMPTQKMLAHIPLVLHPDPHSMLMIGLGCGGTAAAALTHPIESLTALEISPGVIRARPLFTPFTGDLEKEPRFKILCADGRNYLQHDTKTYDVVVSEPSNPWCAGIATLYTREFFEIERAHLKPGGIMAQWMHVYEMDTETFQIIIRTFREVFPHVEIFNMVGVDVVMLGSEKPIRMDGDTVLKGMSRPGVKESLKEINITAPMTFLAHHVIASEEIDEFAGIGRINVDDCPIVEFKAPRAFAVNAKANLPTPVHLVTCQYSPLRKYLATHVPTSEEVLELPGALKVQFAAHIYVTMITEALERDPNNPWLRLERARLNIGGDNYAEALADLDILATTHPDHPDVDGLRLNVYTQLEGRNLSFTRPREFKRSREVAEKLVKLNPKDAPSHTRLASVYFNEQRWADAEREFRESIQLTPATPSTAATRSGNYLYLAACRLEAGNAKGAAVALAERVSAGLPPSSDRELEQTITTRIKVGLMKLENSAAPAGR